VWTFHESAIQTTIDLSVYRLTAVQKAGYRFADRCTAVLGSVEQGHLILTLLFGPCTTAADAQEVARLFHQELLDQELREALAAETRAMRSLILAHAFSRTDLLRRD
jgi:His-Xaa-Ser system protein HxsD